MLVKVGWKKDFIEKNTPVMPISGWIHGVNQFLQSCLCMATTGVVQKRPDVDLRTSGWKIRRMGRVFFRPDVDPKKNMEGYLFWDVFPFFFRFFPGFCLIWLLSFLVFVLCLVGVWAF